MENTWIDYNYIHIEFNWQWIKDKTILHRGDSERGTIMILDDTGSPIKLIAYEMVSEG